MSCILKKKNKGDNKRWTLNFRENEGRLYLSSSELDTRKSNPTQNKDREQDLAIDLQTFNLVGFTQDHYVYSRGIHIDP